MSNGLSISTALVPGDLDEKLAAIAAAGFKGVALHEPDLTGFSGSPEDIRAMAAARGLTIDALSPFRDLEGLPGRDRGHAFERLRCKLDLAGKLGCASLILCSTTRDDADSALVEADLREAAALAGAAGVRLAVLAMPWSCTIDKELDALALIERIDDPALGLALHSGFSLAGGVQPARLRDIPMNRLFHISLVDAWSDHSLRTQPDLLPGQGDLNLFGFTRLLARNGYAGPWSLGGIGEAHRRSDPQDAAHDGWRSLVTLLDTVGRSEPKANFGIPVLAERVPASGFEFIEFAVEDESADALTAMLAALCFRRERQHVSKSVELWRQGAVNIVVNTARDGFAREALEAHGPGVCDMGLRVRDGAATVARAATLGTPAFSQPVGEGELDIPAIRGVGGSVVHFIDEKSELHRVWDIEFDPVPQTETVPPAGLRRIDHVAQTMRYEEMQSWLLYYISTFEMTKSAMVGVADPSGLVRSQAVETPEGEVRLNLNGAQDSRTLASGFLEGNLGAGVQHIAFSTDDIFETAARLAGTGFASLPISPNYYADLQAVFGLDDGTVEALRAANILYDRDGRGEYFQLYGTPLFGGFFFEIVERRGGYAGYGARNASVRLAAQAAYLKEQR